MQWGGGAEGSSEVQGRSHLAQIAQLDVDGHVYGVDSGAHLGRVVGRRALEQEQGLSRHGVGVVLEALLVVPLELQGGRGGGRWCEVLAGGARRGPRAGRAGGWGSLGAEGAKGAEGARGAGGADGAEGAEGAWQHTCRCSRRMHRQHGSGEGDSCGSRGESEQMPRRRAEQVLRSAQGGGVREGRAGPARPWPHGMCTEGPLAWAAPHSGWPNQGPS